MIKTAAILSMARLVDRITVFSGLLAFAAIMAAVVLVNHMVLIRVLGESVVWHMELAIYLVVGAFFLAVPYAVKKRGHIAVELIFALLPPWAAHKLQICVHLLVIVTAGYLALGGAEEALNAYETGLSSTSLWGPPLWPVYASMPVGLLLASLQGASEITKMIACRKLAVQ